MTITREHGTIKPEHIYPPDPAGRGVHGMCGFISVADEAARGAILQASTDRSRVVEQTGGVHPGLYVADGVGGWFYLGGYLGEPGAYTVEAHAARHEAGGEDAIDPAALLPAHFSRAEVLVYTDVAHKVVGPLAAPPVVSEVMLTPLGGIAQKIGAEFTVRQVMGGVAPGYYVCVSPTSSAPGGGTFLSGSNPTVGLESELDDGDEVQVAYATWPIP